MTREQILRTFTSWKDKDRARCESETVLEERVANIFGMPSKPYLYHLAGLCTGEDVWGTVVDLGLYTRFLDVRVVIVDTGKIRGDSSAARAAPKPFFQESVRNVVWFALWDMQTTLILEQFFVLRLALFLT